MCLTPDVVISELCLSHGTQMHCELLLPLFQAQVLVDNYTLKAFYFQLAYEMEGGPKGEDCFKAWKPSSVYAGIL